MPRTGAGNGPGAATPPLELRPHPASTTSALRAFHARATLTAAGMLLLDYRLVGDIARLRLPPPAVPQFRSGLWRHTCFEAFVAAGAAAGYLELNLSPSGEWAAYRFSGYRSGMAPLNAVAEPVILCDAAAESLRVMATVDLSRLPLLADAGPLRAGIAAVLERDDDVREYWALAHPAPDPDFHHPGAFALALTS